MTSHNSPTHSRYNCAINELVRCVWLCEPETLANSYSAVVGGVWGWWGRPPSAPKEIRLTLSLSSPGFWRARTLCGSAERENRGVAGPIILFTSACSDNPNTRANLNKLNTKVLSPVEIHKFKFLTSLCNHPGNLSRSMTELTSINIPIDGNEAWLIKFQYRKIGKQMQPQSFLVM